MDGFDESGLFWHSSMSADDALSGRLVFDPERGITLTLIGSFDDGLSSLARESNDAQPFVLYGWIGNREVTLIDCYRGKYSHRSQGISESSFMANAIFRGAHLTSASLEFDAAHLRSNGGADWVGQRIESRERSKDSFLPDWLSYDEPRPQRCGFARGELEVSYSWSSNDKTSASRVQFEHWPVFSLYYTGLTSFGDIRGDLGRIEDLISLCADSTTTPMRISLRRPDIRVRMLDGSEAPHPREIEYIAPVVDVKHWKGRRPHEMILTFDEVGGVSGVAKWLDEAPRFQRSLNSLISVKRAGRMYGENRFLNVAFAVEALHRDLYGGVSLPVAEFNALRESCLRAVAERHSEWLDQRLRYVNEMSLRNRLRNLMDRVGAEALPFLERPNHWINVIVEVRNGLTHLDSARSGFEGDDLYYLAESLYVLARAVMLVEAGVSKSAIGAKSADYHFAWYATRLNRTVDTLRRRL